MGEYTFDWADASPCPVCDGDVPLDVENCPECDSEVPFRLTIPQLLVAFTSGQILDVRSGGLVWGRHGPEEDIPMYRAAAPGILQLSAVMHGGEFIVNAMATAENFDRLEEINGFKGDDGWIYEPLQSIPLRESTRIFNTNGLDGPDSHLVVLIQTGQYIINRAATIRHFDELQSINDSVAPKLG